MPVKGGRKGAAFEREVSVAMSLWATKGSRRDVFWRTAMSGGRATVHNKRSGAIDIRQAGDIGAVSPEGTALCDAFYFETKFYRCLDLQRFLLFNEGKTAKFWKRACDEAYEHGRIPVMIVRENFTPTLLITSGVSPFNDIEPLASAQLARAHVYSFDDAIKVKRSRKRAVPRS